MDRVEELNHRITGRNLPSDMLEPVFDPRPANTKGGLMPVTTPHKSPNEEFFTYKTYHPETTFAPATRSPPFKGFCERINEESELRGQVFALQRSEKPTYIPSSQSDLYVVDVPFKPIMNEDVNHMYNGLFNKEEFDNFNPAPPQITKEQVFNNDTKQNIKNI